MKRFILFAILLLHTMCTPPKRAPETQTVSMDIKFYKLDHQKQYNERITVEKSTKNELPKYFRYKYRHSKEGDDLLEIYQDSVVLNNTLLSFISAKDFTIRERKFKIKRFDYEPITPGEISANIIQVYIHDTHGLILFFNLSFNNVTEYYPEDLTLLPSLILQDSVFTDWRRSLYK